MHHFKIIVEDEYGQIKESADQLFTAGILSNPIINTSANLTGTNKAESTTQEENLTKQDLLEKEKDRVTVEIAVFDTDGNPVPGARVEIHSTPRAAYTDKDGIARFPSIEKGEHTIFLAFKGLLGKRIWEAQAATTDDDGTPLQRVAIEMSSSANEPNGWLTTLLFGTFGGIIGAFIVGFSIRHQFSKKSILGIVGLILIPLILALVWIIYSWYERL